MDVAATVGPLMTVVVVGLSLAVMTPPSSFVVFITGDRRRRGRGFVLGPF